MIQNSFSIEVISYCKWINIPITDWCPFYAARLNSFEPNNTPSVANVSTAQVPTICVNIFHKNINIEDTSTVNLSENCVIKYYMPWWEWSNMKSNPFREFYHHKSNNSIISLAEKGLTFTNLAEDGIIIKQKLKGVVAWTFAVGLVEDVHCRDWFWHLLLKQVSLPEWS